MVRSPAVVPALLLGEAADLGVAAKKLRTLTWRIAGEHSNWLLALGRLLLVFVVAAVVVPVARSAHSTVGGGYGRSKMAATLWSSPNLGCDACSTGDWCGVRR